MIGIYKITSPSGRAYVGQSTNIKQRWWKYSSLDCSDQPKLYNSFLKYGVKNHQFEVLEECKIETLNERERYYQEQHNVIKNGLNCKLVRTKDRSGYCSDETKRKISEANTGRVSSMKGRKHSKETKLKMSISQKKVKSDKRGRRKGRKRSKETILKMSLAKKGRPAANKRDILQIDLEGNLIKEWASITEAQKMTGFTGIANALTHICKTSGGFTWKYKNEVIK